MSAAPSLNPTMAPHSKRSNYSIFFKLTTLDYVIIIIIAKPRSSRLDDLRLVLFYNIVAF